MWFIGTPTGFIRFLEIKAGESRLVKSALPTQDTKYLPSSSFKGLTGELGKTQTRTSLHSLKAKRLSEPSLAMCLFLAAKTQLMLQL